MPRVSVLALSAALAFSAAPAAHAGDAGALMQRFSGAWIGTGQVLFGAEPRAEFACELKNDPKNLTFGMRGQCRMGAFSAPVYAELRYNAETQRYYGAFMDGAAGSGADIVGTQAGNAAISLKLMRGTMQGRLAAETLGEDQMKVIIYYRDPNTRAETPVIAMGFTRKDVITGSITPRN
jgi:hypothetical protein